MPRPPLWYLKSVELFTGISEEEMHELVSGVIDKQMDKKEFIYTPQDLVENVYVLKEGEVTLYKSVDGKRVVLDILKPGSVFGNIGFDAEGSDRHYAEITEKAYICTLPSSYFLQILKKRPEVALRALKVLSKRLSQYEAQIKALSTLQAKDRILATVRLVNQKDSESILPDVLKRPTKITHEKLGNMTGLTRETVTKQLNELEKAGMIRINRKQIHLTESGVREVMEIG
ncbi:MAG: Crp/Fnr family transcriptional regulator [Candidatus Peribacteraceae bacterium]|nr:Crp/Fnr family transcriptional regulator [Candidatus Peribacteraceae bacterium]MDP7454201.1 Crp/Fnr family transcriptional regulator [Candidatus Peribacteraceae bacterium]MDP7646265.1 Crp/Fnr family transcriptional regulator [Candidatus Peribacteraceae bacterium]